MKKIIIPIVTLTFLILVGCNSNTTPEIETHTEAYEGTVTYYSQVYGSDENFIIKIKTVSGNEISLTVLPTSKIVDNKQIHVGDEVKLICEKESESTYRYVTELEITSES